MRRVSAYSANLFLSFIWALYIVLSRYAVQHLSLFMIGFLSRLVAVAGLSLWILCKKERVTLFSMQNKGGLLLLIGIFAFLLDASAFLGLKYSSAINGSLLLRTDILFILLFSYFFLRERFQPGDWISIILMFLGTFLVMKKNLLQFELRGWGDLMFILSAFLITCNAFIIKLKLSSLRDETIAFYNNLFATIFYGIFSAIGGNSGSLTTPLLLPFTLFLMGICDVFLYISYYYSLRHLPVWVVRILLLLIPVWSIFLGYFFLGERMDYLQAWGMLLLLSGAAYLIWRRRELEEEKNYRIEGVEGRIMVK